MIQILSKDLALSLHSYDLPVSTNAFIWKGEEKFFLHGKQNRPMESKIDPDCIQHLVLFCMYNCFRPGPFR